MNYRLKERKELFENIKKSIEKYCQNDNSEVHLDLIFPTKEGEELYRAKFENTFHKKNIIRNTIDNLSNDDLLDSFYSHMLSSEENQDDQLYLFTADYMKNSVHKRMANIIV